MNDDELLSGIEFLRNTLISVSTGQERIQEVEGTYKEIYLAVSQELFKRHIENPIGFHSLWEWHGRWSKPDLSSYSSRRVFIGELINPLEEKIRSRKWALPELTGWPGVDQAISQIKNDLQAASNEMAYQTIGLKCRETLISLAQIVYDPSKHKLPDDIEVSNTDAKRMLDAYIATELRGKSNEEIRKFAKSVLDVANYLQHNRTATFRDAALCYEATRSVVEVIAILEGKRGKAL